MADIGRGYTRLDGSQVTNPKTSYRSGYFLLSCGHAVTYKIWPDIFDEVYCVRCNEGKLVVSQQYVVRCDDCTYSRGFGNDRHEARRAATKHHFANTEHVVKLFNKLGERTATFNGAPELFNTSPQKRARVSRARVAS